VPDLCKALAARGVDVTLFTVRDEMEATTLDGGSWPFRVRFSRPAFWSRNGETPSIAAYGELKVEVRRADVVHVNSLWNPLASISTHLARKERRPYVVSPRGMLQRTSVQRHAIRKQCYRCLVDRDALTYAAALHFFTEAELSESGAAVPAGVRTVIVPNGIEIPSEEARNGYSKAERLFPALEGRRVMLFVGRLHWSKDIALQCGAFEEVAKSRADVVWVLAGPDAGALRAVETRLRRIGLWRRVVITGLVDAETVAALLDRADVFVLTSRHEAHSRALNEALAAGTPCVTTEAAVVDVVLRYQAVLSCEASAQALAKAIIRVLSEDGLADRLRTAARAVVRDHLSWPRVAEQFEALYREVS
jgi:glycosyltransferase involved in cell wall biosynthesis